MFKINHVIACFMLVLVILVSDVHAQNADEHQELTELSLEELLEVQITSIASGIAKPVKRSPGITSVITAQAIKAMGATKLDEVLNTIPGVHVTTGPIYAPRVTIRGISTVYNPQTLFMVNSIPIKDPVRGGRESRPAYMDIPVAFISRIEVIRGPGSVQHGVDAFSGVINVVTKNADDINGQEAGALFGSFTTHSGWFLHGETIEDLKMALMANYYSTEGHKEPITKDGLGNSGSPNLSSNDVQLRMDLERNRWRLRGSFNSRSNIGLGQGAADVLSPTSRGASEWSLLDLTYNNPKFAKDWEFTGQASLTHANQRLEKQQILFPAGVNLGSGVFTGPVVGNPEFYGREARLSTRLTYKGFDDHILQFAGGFTHEDLYQVKESKNFTNTFAPRGEIVDVSGTDEAFLPTKIRNSFYFYGQEEWKFAKDWELTAGVRYDKYEDFGDTTNPRLALVWDITPALTGKLLYGSAFRVPSFLELYSANNPVVLGNEKLESETIDVYEAAMNYQATSNWNLGANVYYYKVKGLINFVKDPSPASTLTAQNSTDMKGHGLEFETQYKPFRDLLLVGNYSYQRPINEETDSDAGDFPTHKVYVREEWSVSKNWNLNSQVTQVSKRPRTPSDPRKDLKGYTSVDVIVKRNDAFIKGLEASLAARNIFNADVREPSVGPGPSGVIAIPNDYPQAGRSVLAQLNYRY